MASDLWPLTYGFSKCRKTEFLVFLSFKLSSMLWPTILSCFSSLSWLHMQHKNRGAKVSETSLVRVHCPKHISQLVGDSFIGTDITRALQNRQLSRSCSHSPHWSPRHNFFFELLPEMWPWNSITNTITYITSKPSWTSHHVKKNISNYR